MTHGPTIFYSSLIEKVEQRFRLTAPKYPLEQLRTALEDPAVLGEGLLKGARTDVLILSLDTSIPRLRYFTRWGQPGTGNGFDGLHDEPRPGKPRSIGDDLVERVIVKTLEEQPPHATHWSTRSMAQATGISQTAVSRIWRAFGLKPHQTEAFKLSPDPQFIDKVRDIVGLYLNPPDAAVVLCVDQKSPIQALDRTAPILPLMPGVPERQTHDYVRNGTTNLYAALDVACGQVIADMTARYRAEELRRFLNLIDVAVPAHLDVHVVLDNSSTHKTPAIQRWLVRHPRFTVHFTPTYGSWLNLVERWFAELTTKWIKRSAHRSVRDLVASIRTWITNWNEDPKPYVSHKTADERSSTASPSTASGSTTQVTRGASTVGAWRSACLCRCGAAPLCRA